MTSSTVVVVYSAREAQEAHMVKAMLADAGIDARVVGDLLGFASGGLPFGQSTSPQVWVAEEDASRARHFIEGMKTPHLTPTPTPTQSWSCPDCGEEVEGELEVCWKCGTSTSGDKAADFPPQPVDETTDADELDAESFNMRVLGLSLLLGAILLAAVGFIGTSLALLAMYGVLSGLFSTIAAWFVTVFLPPQDEQNKDA